MKLGLKKKSKTVKEVLFIMLMLTYMCLNDWHMPVYEDQNGNLWLDVNLGKGEPDLYKSSTNEIDGDPDYSIKEEYEFATKYEESPYILTYMKLGRLIATCDYFLGYGTRSENIVAGKNGSDTINEMKELWNSLPPDSKPEWLTMEEILEYEQEMANPSGKYNNRDDWGDYKISNRKSK